MAGYFYQKKIENIREILSGYDVVGTGSQFKI